jgi:two-component sensor histidine kinase
MGLQEKNTILIVDDESLVAMAEANTIKQFGYKVIIANTGEKAVLLAVKNKDINLILMDINLGKGIDGTEAARQILSKRTVPIVFLTSHSEQEMVEKVRGITRYGYVIKNSGNFVLQSSIEMALELFNANEKIEENEKIRNLLQEKELLLREVHHRIKNNMAVIASLLSLQSSMLNDSSAVSSLEDARSRVQSMMVLYDKLYRSGDFRKISTKEYLITLIDEIVGNFPNLQLVTIKKKIDDVLLDAKTLSPIGIILNELLTNIMKHAFIGRENGIIGVTFLVKETHVTLIVEDNGIGIPESIDITTSTGFGLQLVGMLTKQLEGTIRIERKNGSQFILEYYV